MHALSTLPRALRLVLADGVGPSPRCVSCEGLAVEMFQHRSMLVSVLVNGMVPVCLRLFSYFQVVAREVVNAALARSDTSTTLIRRCASAERQAIVLCASCCGV